MKNILVTGGSKGIGFAIAECFAKDPNNRVIIVSRKREALEEAVFKIKETTKNQNVIYYEANWTSLEQIKRVFEDIKLKFNHLNVLINNVALSLVFGSTLETTES